MRYLSGMFLVAGFLVACGPTPEDVNQLKVQAVEPHIMIDNDMDVSGMDRDEIAAAIKTLKAMMVDGDSQVTFAQIMAVFPVATGDAKAKIDDLVAKRQVAVPVTCSQLRCTGTNTGSPAVIQIPEKNITIKVENEITFSMRIMDNDQAVEFCRMSGVHAKKGFFGGYIDGGKLQISPEKVESFMVDVGFGGSYPVADCDF